MNRLANPVLFASFLILLLSSAAGAGPVSDLQSKYQAIHDNLNVRYRDLRDAWRDEDWQAVRAAQEAIRLDEERLESCRRELSVYTFQPQNELLPYDPAEAMVEYDSISDRPYYRPYYRTIKR